MARAGITEPLGGVLSRVRIRTRLACALSLLTALGTVATITRGSAVEFPNADPFVHNAFSLSRGATFDLGRFPRGEIAPDVVAVTDASGIVLAVAGRRSAD
jgi:hypothetical protein